MVPDATLDVMLAILRNTDLDTLPGVVASELKTRFGLSSAILILLDDAPPAVGIAAPTTTSSLAVAVESWRLSVPISTDGRALGLLEVHGDELDGPPQDIVAALEQLSGFIGAVVAQAHERVVERLRLDQLVRLQNITARVIGRDHALEDYGALLADIAQTFNFANVGLGLFEGERVRFVTAYWPPRPDEQGVRFVPAATGIAGRATRTGEPQFVEDVLVDPDYIDLDSGTLQEIAAPIITNGERVGIMNAELDSRRKLVLDDLDILVLLAHSFGLVISAQRRLERLRRRNLQLQLVERVVAMIAATPRIRESLDAVVDAIVETFDFGLCSVSLVDDGILRGVAVRAADGSNVVEYEGPVAASGAGVVGRVAATGEPAFIQNVNADPDYIPRGLPAASEICLPIHAGGRVAGVLNVEATSERPLDDDDFEVLSIIANHLGIALTGEDLFQLEVESRREIEALQRVSSIVATTLDFDRALELIVATLAEGFGYEYIGVGLIEDDFIVPHAAHGWPLARLMAAPLGAMAPGQVAQTGEPLFIPRIADAPEYAASAAMIDSRITVPIHAGGDVVGILDVGGGKQRPVTERDILVLETFAQSAGMALHNARMYAEMQRLATTDSVTALPNNRVLLELLDEEIEHAARDASELSLLIIDLDRFKDVNDRFGHLAGDEVLRALAQRMLAELRKGDLLARYAGDEFVVLLPHVGRVLALEIASRLRRAVMGMPFEVAVGTQAALTVSIGAASYPESAVTALELVRRADLAMYRAKRLGRNAVAFADNHGDG